MASLKFIMDPEVDHPDPSTRGTIRAPGSFATPLTSRAPDSSAHQGHVPTSGQDQDNYSNTIDDYHINNNKDGNPGYPPRPSTAASTPTAASDASASAADSSLLSRRRHAGSQEDALRSPGATSSSSRHANPRRRSTTSPDSMDRHSYPPPTPMGASGGGAGGGVPVGRGGISRQGGIGGGMGQLSHPMRPMPPHPPTESPIRLTPITGRISRAKKGQPVHICEVCRPPKTFTRAEHLRRHQLSHRTPGFACEWPGCDRAFHRHDLLVRHQQKHEQEGDAASSPGGEPRRGSSASTLEGMPQRGSVKHPGAASGSGSASGMGNSTPASSCGVPSTPNVTNALLPSVGSSPGDVTISGISPHNIGRGRRDRPASSRQPQDSYGGSYVLSTTAPANPVLQYATASTSLESPNAPTPTAFNHINYPHQQPPRSLNNSLFVVTQGLSGPSVHIQDGPIPDLISTTDVSLSSPWASSTDSTYSTTPSEPRGHPQAWTQRQGSPPRNEWLSPFPATSEALATPYLFTPSPQMVSPHQGYSMHPGNQYSIIDVNMGGAFPAAEDPSQGLQHHVMGVDSGSSAAMNHGSVGPRNSISLSSVGSPSPITAPARRAESLITPSTSLHAERVGMMAGHGRQKEVMMTDTSDMGMAVSMSGGVSLLGSTPYGLGGGDNSPGGGGFLPSQGLSGMGSCAPGPLLVSNPLAKSVRNMIPTYLDTYWSHHNTAYPLVHRRMSEESGEDVLRCAMAAVGSQLLDSKEDRNKGIVLHDHVVQELKLIAQWNLPIMQAIILCEYFSRFRGRKPATRPSKRFESLCSRVSSSFLDQASDDSSLCPGSSGVPSSTSSSFTSASSRSSWYSESLNTPTALSGFQPFGYDHSPMLLPSSSSAPSFSAEQSLALLSNSGRPAYAAANMGHQYLDQSQAMNRLPSIFEHAPTAQRSPHLTTDQRWRAWLDAEAHRRLLNACFSLDVHTSIYHEHHRSRDFNLSEPGRVPPIPLIGRSRELWDAQSAEQWDAILNEDPDAGIPLFIPHPDELTPMIPGEGSASGCHGIPLNTFDRLAILDFEASRLPKRTVAGASPGSSDGGSPTPVADDNNGRSGADWSVLESSYAGSIGLELVDRANPDLAPLDVEARISYLFPGCPVANTYLALHHTPLHDLLAVCGDSCMLSPKSLADKPIHNSQKRVRLWAEQGQVSAASLGLNKSVVKATMYAARALLDFLGPDACLDASGGSFGATMCKISDYWALYVCALICWSSGHLLTQGGEQIGSDVAASHREALEWLRSAAHAQPDDTNAWAHIWSSRRTIGIVSLVRRRLELDLKGARSRLHSDAVAVLKKIEEGANWRWF